jgi:predicted GNAT superfamily acetyltransferase
VAAPVATGTVEIREVSAPHECAQVSALFTSIWGGHQHIPPELGRAIAEAGGYVVGAYADHQMVGASVAVVGQADGRMHLHSHITGVVPGEQGRGVGLALKRHQRTWARERAMDRVVWTFDPLVRRNAWFNLARLGATAVRYEVDFYGPVRDAINGADETDRLVVEWATEVDDEGPGAITPQDGDLVIETPSDIVAMRAGDPVGAQRWRVELREALGERLTTGWRVVGVTTVGAYVIRDTAAPAFSGRERITDDAFFAREAEGGGQAVTRSGGRADHLD